MTARGVLKRELFRPATTYKDDFQYPHVPCCVEDRIECVQKVGVEHSTPLPTDYESLSSHGFAIPFTIYHRPKEILQINSHVPCVINIKFDQTVKEEKDDRPRVVHPPALPMNELDKLLDDEKAITAIRTFPFLSTYQVSYTKDKDLLARPRQKDIMVKIEHKPAKVRHCAHQGFALPAGWAHAATAWDRKQTRTECNPTAAFWACYRHPSQPTDEIDQGLKAKIRDLAHNWKLTEPYTTPISSYGGYIPRLARGVPMEKEDKCSHDPRVSLNQAIQTQMKSKEMCEI